MAEVFRAQHRETRAEVAVKILRAEMASQKRHLKAFEDEFSMLQGLSHPGIPNAKLFDTVLKRPCFVMEFILGRPMHLVAEDHQPPFDPIAIFSQLIDIVAYLHGEGIAHNDLKLENILLRENGRISLVDFGNARQVVNKGLFAKLFGRKEPVVGTPTYVAPELISGEGEPSLRSDLYSLGVCCFVIYSGEPPFASDRKSARLRAAVNQPAPSLRGRCATVPPSLDKLIDGCLAKNPQQRLADAVQFKAAFALIQRAYAKTKPALPLPEIEV